MLNFKILKLAYLLVQESSGGSAFKEPSQEILPSAHHLLDVSMVQHIFIKQFCFTSINIYEKILLLVCMAGLCCSRAQVPEVTHFCLQWATGITLLLWKPLIEVLHGGHVACQEQYNIIPMGQCSF